MYPDLSFLLHDLIGTPRHNAFSIIKTFGFFLALAFLASRHFFIKELKRKEAQGIFGPTVEKMPVGYPASISELIINGLLGFVIGYKLLYLLVNYASIGADIVPFLVSAKGSFVGGLVMAGLFSFLHWWTRNKEKLPKPGVKEVKVWPHQRATDITIRAAISGILGAKLFAIFESTDTIQAFLRSPLTTFFSGSGLAIYGGLIVAFMYVYWYVRSKGMKPIHVMDVVAPALIMGYAVGRIGCQLSGDGDWGIINDQPLPSWWFLPEWMWAYDYPHNVLEMGVPIEGCEGAYCRRLAQPVYPTPFYETVLSLVIFGILWGLRKRITIPGMLFYIYLIFNGFERFWIEKIRVNDKIPFLGMQPSQAEIISFLLFFVGIAGCIVLYTRSRSTERQRLNDPPGF